MSYFCLNLPHYLIAPAHLYQHLNNNQNRRNSHSNFYSKNSKSTKKGGSYENLSKNNGATDISFRKKMAYKVFRQTAQYDKLISNWLNEK